jgi:hypothetical protein
MAFRITTFSITAFSITANKMPQIAQLQSGVMLCVIDAECHKKSFMLSVIVLNVATMSVVMQSAIMLSVVASFGNDQISFLYTERKSAL